MKAYFTRVPRLTPHTDPTLWPVTMRIADVATVTRQSAGGLYRRVKRGTAQPPPAMTAKGDPIYPLHWDRAVVLAWIRGAFTEKGRAA